MKTVYIYALLDPDTQEVRYVGASSNPTARRSQHVMSRGSSNSPKDRWIKELIAQGKYPGLIVLEESQSDIWKTAERKWIAHYCSTNPLLVNVRDGGNAKVEGCDSEVFFSVCLKQLVLNKSARDGHTVSLKDLARITGISAVTIRQWYTGEVSRIEAKTVNAFTQYLGVTMSDLVSMEAQS